MSGQTIRLGSPFSRVQAHRLIEAAPAGSTVNIRAATRTTEQNSKLWAALSDISRAKPQGRVLPPELWKCLFMSACGHQCRFEPSLDGSGVVPIGFKSSRLSKVEMSELIECVMAFGAEHGVVWSDEQRDAA